MSRPIFWAPISWEHHGSHSGMAPLSREIQIIAPGFIQRIQGKPRKPQPFDRLENGARRLLRLRPKVPDWIKIREQVPFYSENSWVTEREISEKVTQSNPSAVILEAIEDQFFLLANERKNWRQTRLIGISHQPPAWWQLNHARPDLVTTLDLLIVLASSVRPYWETFLDKEKVVFIPHGVDSEFFSPSSAETKLSTTDGNLHVVFSGQWLRDFETMEGVVTIADKANLPVRFEMIVPRFARGTDICYRIAMSPHVRWHSGLTDEGLRAIYRQSDLLLLTLQDSTGNNGLLEGMACGLPVIVTDVGGARDYAMENFTDFVPPRNGSSIVKIIQGYLAQKDELVGRGAAARAHVENRLSWRKIAANYTTLLRSLTKD
jgi:glycosyltransferase involved in cell wall biosynthesis